MKKFDWVGRRWVDFTKGYSGYLTFVVNFSTFVTVLYGLAPLIKDELRFPIFVLIAVMAIIPTAILIGHLHFSKQYPVEQGVAFKKSPYTYQIIRNSKEEIMLKAMISLMESNNGDPKIIEQLRDLVKGYDSRSIIGTSEE